MAGLWPHVTIWFCSAVTGPLWEWTNDNLSESDPSALWSEAKFSWLFIRCPRPDTIWPSQKPRAGGPFVKDSPRWERVLASTMMYHQIKTSMKIDFTVPGWSPACVGEPILANGADRHWKPTQKTRWIKGRRQFLLFLGGSGLLSRLRWYIGHFVTSCKMSCLEVQYKMFTDLNKLAK